MLWDFLLYDGIASRKTDLSLEFLFSYFTALFIVDTALLNLHVAYA